MRHRLVLSVPTVMFRTPPRPGPSLWLASCLLAVAACGSAAQIDVAGAVVLTDAFQVVGTTCNGTGEVPARGGSVIYLMDDLETYLVQGTLSAGRVTGDACTLDFALGSVPGGGGPYQIWVGEDIDSPPFVGFRASESELEQGPRLNAGSAP